MEVKGGAARQGAVVRRGLKEAWSKAVTWRTETGYEAGLAGRGGQWSWSPYPSRARAVYPAGVRRRRRCLLREACAVSRRRDWGGREAGQSHVSLVWNMLSWSFAPLICSGATDWDYSRLVR